MIIYDDIHSLDTVENSDEDAVQGFPVITNLTYRIDNPDDAFNMMLLLALPASPTIH